MGKRSCKPTEPALLTVKTTPRKEKESDTITPTIVKYDSHIYTPEAPNAKQNAAGAQAWQASKQHKEETETFARITTERSTRSGKQGRRTTTWRLNKRQGVQADHWHISSVSRENKFECACATASSAAKARFNCQEQIPLRRATYTIERNPFKATINNESKNGSASKRVSDTTKANKHNMRGNVQQ